MIGFNPIGSFVGEGGKRRAMTSLKRHGLFVFGALSAFVALLGLAEAYLRLAPPEELLPFLGEDVRRTGSYRADPVYGLDYGNVAAFQTENSDRLARFASLFAGASAKPVWAFFGNSFVQAPGMLADTARARMRDREIFHLGRNTPLPIRFAQVGLLLRLGLKPERIFISFRPIDTLNIGRFPIDTIRVTSGGALGYEPWLPPGWSGRAIQSSRILLASWVRANRHYWNPRYSIRHVHGGIDRRLLADILKLFSALADVTRSASIPVTVLLMPDLQQLLRGAPYVFQDTLAAHLRPLGLDVFDPRRDLQQVAQPLRLFIPNDGHYTPLGNEIMFEALLRHLGRGG
jgi:hypothetical protein